MSRSLGEQVEALAMISDAQREKINKLLKSIEVLTKERDMALEHVTMLETQIKSIEVSEDKEASKDNAAEAANVWEMDD